MRAGRKKNPPRSDEISHFDDLVLLVLLPPTMPLVEPRTMWGFLRVENEHLRIYGDVGSPGSGVENQAGGSAGGNGSAVAGLDRLPYSRMEISNGIMSRATTPIKAWCLNRVSWRFGKALYW